MTVFAAISRVDLVIHLGVGNIQEGNILVDSAREYVSFMALLGPSKPGATATFISPDI
jgi:hypothetical protein